MSGPPGATVLSLVLQKQAVRRTSSNMRYTATPELKYVRRASSTLFTEQLSQRIRRSSSNMLHTSSNVFHTQPLITYAPADQQQHVTHTHNSPGSSLMRTLTPQASLSVVYILLLRLSRPPPPCSLLSWCVSAGYWDSLLTAALLAVGLRKLF